MNSDIFEIIIIITEQRYNNFFRLEKQDETVITWKKKKLESGSVVYNFTWVSKNVRYQPGPGDLSLSRHRYVALKLYRVIYVSDQSRGR